MNHNFPDAVVNQMLLLISHPCADMIRDHFKQKEEEESGEEDYNDRCSACVELWDDCQCWCSHCWRTMPEGRYTCEFFS